MGSGLAFGSVGSQHALHRSALTPSSAYSSSPVGIVGKVTGEMSDVLHYLVALSNCFTVYSAEIDYYPVVFLTAVTGDMKTTSINTVVLFL